MSSHPTPGNTHHLFLRVKINTHMPVSFSLPFGTKKEDEESNESRRTVGSTTSATENHRGGGEQQQQQETVGLAFGKIWECYCAFRSPLFFLSL